MKKKPGLFDGKKIGKYIIVAFLGKGNFGEVYRVVHSETAEEFAVKVINKGALSDNPHLEIYFNIEKQIMFNIDHKNILHLYDHLESKNNHYLIVDYCNQGTLEEHLKKQKKGYFTEFKATKYLKQIADAFIKLRQHKILHRDIKLDNILLHNGIVKVADFGVSKIGSDIGETMVGTPLTQAPEIYKADLEDGNYNSKADLWSVGVVFYRMLFGKHPFNGANRKQLYDDILSKCEQGIEYPRKISPQSQELLDRIFVVEPNNRMKWSEFFSFFKLKPTEDKKHFSLIKNFSFSIFNEDEQVMKKPNYEIDNVFFTNSFDFAKDKTAKRTSIKYKTNDDDLTRVDDDVSFSNILKMYNKNRKLIFANQKKLYNYYNSLKLDLNFDLPNTIILLCFKAVITNQNFQYCLYNKINIFDIEEHLFEDFCNSADFKNLVKLFSIDKKKLYSGLINNIGMFTSTDEKILEIVFDFISNYNKIKKELRNIHLIIAEDLSTESNPDAHDLYNTINKILNFGFYKNNIGKIRFTEKLLYNNPDYFDQNEEENEEENFNFDYYDLYMKDYLKIFIGQEKLISLEIPSVIEKKTVLLTAFYEISVYLSKKLQIMMKELGKAIKNETNLYNLEKDKFDQFLSEFEYKVLKRLNFKMDHTDENVVNLIGKIQENKPNFLDELKILEKSDLQYLENAIFTQYKVFIEGLKGLKAKDYAKHDIFYLLCKIELFIEMETAFFTSDLAKSEIYEFTKNKLKIENFCKIEKPACIIM